jgi:thymidine kinase
MVVEGSQVLVGDTTASPDPESPDAVSYEVLCRTHYRARLTAARAKQEHMSAQPLPFGR